MWFSILASSGARTRARLARSVNLPNMSASSGQTPACSPRLHGPRPTNEALRAWQTRGDAYDTRRPVYRHPLFVQESRITVKRQDRASLNVLRSRTALG